MGDFLDQLHQVWPLITQAPWAFAAFAFSLLGLGFLAGRFAFGERIENLKSRIETRDERIGAYEAAETARRLEKERSLSIEKDKPTPKRQSFDVTDALGPRTVRLLASQVAKAPTAPTTFVATNGMLKDILIGRQWIFHFSPSGNNGRKNMTFLPDGSIGEGRNENEYRWVFEGDQLAIYRRNGDVQNSFRYNASSDRFEYLPDGRAQGFKDQYIQPR
ncbi:MAG: hypothetical protein E5X34_10505 [Mesorhizobium sp.]|uniref:hypothetical protein n=1 Tax=Mesorhizobium sp. TaxID=1871066 RepID=UPI00121FFBA1|nr:hypothetical protein [Mesorhizobium sp.]TIR25111.1 MAG: hypothetical protein E5X34_10505 [Mesorhizobium sp.]